MLKMGTLAAALASAVLMLLMTAASNAAPYGGTAGLGTAAGSTSADMLHDVQYRGAYRGRGGYRPPVYRPPAFRPPRYRGPARAWAYRPWYRRPYYGTIIGGIALGTILGVTAYGLAPPPPRPDLCWYWADPIQSRGYWDYC